MWRTSQCCGKVLSWRRLQICGNDARLITVSIVFSSQSSKSDAHDPVVHRLENLFWRIWGNGSVRRSLSGATLAKLFLAVTESRSPHLISSQSASEVVRLPRRMTVVNVDTDVGEQGAAPTTKNASGEVSPAQNDAGDQSMSRKCSDTESEQAVAASSKRPKSVIWGPSAQQKPRSTSPTKAPSKAPKAFPESDAQKATRKRTSFVANIAATSRRRGVLPRRKSSQTCPTVGVAERPGTDQDSTPTQETTKSGCENPSPQKSAPGGRV